MKIELKFKKLAGGYRTACWWLLECPAIKFRHPDLCEPCPGEDLNESFTRKRAEAWWKEKLEEMGYEVEIV